MNELFNKIRVCCAALALLAACDKSGDLPEPEPNRGPGSGCIFLDFSAGAMGASRAAGASAASGISAAPGASAASTRSFDTGFESRVDHIDVLVFADEADTDSGIEAGAKVCCERIDASANVGRTASLAARRSSFKPGAKYWVYLIANASDTEKEQFAAADFDRNALRAMRRADRYLHLAGLPNNTENSTGYDLPQNFLMDGVAYTGDAEPELKDAGPVVLNNGDPAADTYLKATLRRAAVKLVLKIAKGDRITFIDPTNEGETSGIVSTGGYYLRNMPFTTPLVSGEADEPEVRTPLQTINRYFEVIGRGFDETITGAPLPTAQGYTVTAYAYAHSWATGSVVERETRWIVDLPLYYNDGAKAREYHEFKNCYYQIPVCAGTELKRNTCYTVSVTINQPGGTNPSKPVALEGVTYSVQDWIDEDIPVGGEGDRPMFLTVNRAELEMHNTDKDETTLEFASSSAVKAEFNTDDSGQYQVYYYDKFGQKTYLEKKYPDNPDDNTWGIKTVTGGSGRWDPEIITWSNECQIRIVPDGGINGKIKIYSDVPKNNTMRYVEIKVTNEDNATPRYVTIKQYPLEYITNIQGHYSYRSDFGGTSYVNPGPNRYVTATSYDSNTGKWDYSTSAESGFFRSKVAQDKGAGKSTLKFYTFYSYSGWWPTPTNTPQIGSTSSGLDNARMYHIRITASSDSYTIGRPRITDGKTDGGDDNAKLVSPSFMIASQLGAVNSTNCKSVEMAASHCREYVEVSRDGKVYDDWRLPTAAEIAIIMKYQKQGDAIDEVLTGERYWCASGCIRTSDYVIVDDQGSPIRCIRDAYDDPTDTKEADPASDAQ